jgi:AraC-like DNA-binding protein
MQAAAKSESAVSPPGFFSLEVAAARRFYSDLNPSPRQRLVVVCGGLEHCKPDYAIHRPTFPYLSIEYVARGAGELKLDGSASTLRAGSVFTYGPGVAHDIASHPANPLVKYFVDFAGTEALGLLRRCHLEPGRAARVFPPHALSALLDELIESGLHGGPENMQLCARLLECLALKIAVRSAPEEGPAALAFASYQHCRRHIEQHFLRLRTLDEIGRECRFDTAYLCRLFRRYDSQTPYQHLMRLKIQYAAQRLQQPGVLIKQVAAETGFSDPSHFSRVFRKFLGVSPQSFRTLR